LSYLIACLSTSQQLMNAASASLLVACRCGAGSVRSREEKDERIRSSLGGKLAGLAVRGAGAGAGAGSQAGCGMDGLGGGGADEWAQQKSLAERLRMTVDDLKDFDPLPAQLLRKYIAYAKKYVKPK
jgi:hypothetical protein